MRHGPKLVTVQRAADMFGLSRASVEGAINRGELTLVGGARRLLSVRDVGRYASVLLSARCLRATWSRTHTTGDAGRRR